MVWVEATAGHFGRVWTKAIQIRAAWSFVLVPLFLSITMFSQGNDEAQGAHVSDFLFHSKAAGTHTHHPKHKVLETELELYGFNVLVPSNNIVKHEAMFDYHVYSGNERLLGGARFFADFNLKYTELREMTDLLLYTELYYGFERFQIGGEVGSMTGNEYFSFGPQFTIYDNKVFKRMAVISRLYPDLILGYEFTTQALHINHLCISATGMCRILPHCDERVVQFSTWFSNSRLHGIYLGMGYEYNDATIFNAHPHARHHDLYVGLKFELN